ncbi:hypothetical protein CFC21_057546 [Triticum aestivum]|uniref:Protein kinase domain-containing protein n=2 Tax=Triticum aestivum TaxID=4565 RepID=A0A3B6IS94_WHEAT|nr:uncharacterized protein LOC123094797 [Triticum aestivum]KAF7048888.1 hypothetical protein CFC21_057546 [Triticum aestivum]
MDEFEPECVGALVSIVVAMDEFEPERVGALVSAVAAAVVPELEPERGGALLRMATAWPWPSSNVSFSDDSCACHFLDLARSPLCSALLCFVRISPLVGSDVFFLIWVFARDGKLPRDAAGGAGMQQKEPKQRKVKKPNPLSLEYSRSGACAAGAGRPRHVAGRYELGGELGRWEFRVTYLCTDHATRDALACKSISKKKLHTAVDIEDVRREVEIMRHPQAPQHRHPHGHVQG